MQLYHYNPNSCEYTHTTNAQENPRNKGKYFEQAYSTFAPIPELQSAETAIRNIENNEWLITQDHRGKIWDTKTKVQSELTELGPIPKGKTSKAPCAFDSWDGAKWLKNEEAEKNSRIAIARKNARALIDLALSKSIEFDGVLFDYTATAKDSILETIEEAQILSMNDTESTGWRLADNSIRETSVADLKEVVKIGALRRRAVNEQYSVWTQTDMQNAFEIQS